MKIAICDDELQYRQQELELIKEYISCGSRNISVTAYENGEDLMDDAKKIGGYDIYILDVLMPWIDGIKLGLQLREAGFDSPILYLTSSEEYAIDAFRAKAFNYILKPIKKEELFSALDDAINSIANKLEKSIIVKTKEGSQKLSFDSILYADLSKRAVLYHLINDKTIESTTIRTTFAEAVQEMLQDTRFVLCGASMIVNLHHITIVENDALLYKNGSKVYIGKRASRELRSVWYDFWFNGEVNK